MFGSLVEGSSQARRQRQRMRHAIEESWHDWTRARRCIRCGTKYTRVAALFGEPRCTLHPMGVHSHRTLVGVAGVRPTEFAGHHACCGYARAHHHRKDRMHRSGHVRGGCYYADHVDHELWVNAVTDREVGAKFFDRTDPRALEVHSFGRRLTVIPLFILENLAVEHGAAASLERAPDQLHKQLAQILHSDAFVLVTDPQDILRSTASDRRKVVASGTQQIAFDARDAYLHLTHEYQLPTHAFAAGANIDIQHLEHDNSDGHGSSADIARRIGDVMNMFDGLANTTTTTTTPAADGDNAMNNSRTLSVTAHVADYSCYNPMKGEWHGASRAFTQAAASGQTVLYERNDPWAYVEEEDAAADDAGAPTEDEELISLETKWGVPPPRYATESLLSFLRPSLAEKSFYPFLVYSWISRTPTPMAQHTIAHQHPHCLFSHETFAAATIKT